MPGHHAAILLVDDDATALRRIAGLSVAERSVFVLHQAGVSTVVVTGAGAGTVGSKLLASRDLAKRGVDIQVQPEVDWSDLQAPHVIVSGDLVVRGDSFKQACSQPVNAGALVEFRTDTERGLWVMSPERAAELEPTSTEMLREAPSTETVDARGVFRRVVTPQDAKRAEDELFTSMYGAHDGFVARHINKKFSFFISRYLLLPLPITPNQMTLFAATIGAVGVALVLQSTWFGVMLGASLVQIQSILDGCDGEIARLKFKSSKIGAWLDNVVDDILNSVYVLALGIAAADLTGHEIYQWLGIGALSGYAFYHLIVYAQLLLVHRAGNPFAFRWWFQNEDEDIHAKLADEGGGFSIGAFFHGLARRDVFIFAFMCLALVKLPEAAVIWYVVLGGGHALMTAVHLAAGGFTKHRPRD